MHRHHPHATATCALPIVGVVEAVWVDAASAPQGESRFFPKASLPEPSR